MVLESYSPQPFVLVLNYSQPYFCLNASYFQYKEPGDCHGADYKSSCLQCFPAPGAATSLGSLQRRIWAANSGGNGLSCHSSANASKTRYCSAILDYSD